MSSLLLMSLSIVLLVEMSIKKLWKKSISTFMLLVGFAVYFCCDSYGHTNAGSVILAVLMFISYYRAIFKPDSEKIITWRKR
ncbi:MAG: hypothetical protein PHX65_07185 [Sulfurimonas sp.]|nr:hypothetical protein [Sulfurimonas sp.]